MNKHSKYGSYLAFIDMLLGMVALFVALFTIAVIQIQPPSSKVPGTLHAEYVITMTWPDTSFDDIDLHMLLPDHSVVNFIHKDSSYVTLDRDDRGALSDIVKLPDGKFKLIEENREVMTIRSIVPGTYVVNVQVYGTTDKLELNPGQIIYSKPLLPYNVKVVLQKLNPVTKDIVVKNVLVKRIGEQETAFVFTIDPDGEVRHVDTNANVPFIEVIQSNLVPDSDLR